MAIERVYYGERGADGACRVYYIDDKRERTVLPLRLDLENKSPTGFGWGYAGSGPAQLALALLANATGDDARAIASYQAFKFRFVVGLRQFEPWAVSRDTVLLMLSAIERDGPQGRRVQPTYGRKVDSALRKR